MAEHIKMVRDNKRIALIYSHEHNKEFILDIKIKLNEYQKFAGAFL